MGNNILTLAVIVVVFLGFIGTKFFVGLEAIDKNENLDSESIAQIAGLDDNMNTYFQVDPNSKNLSAIRYEQGDLAFDEADPFERATLQDRADVEDFGISYRSVTNIVPSFFASTPFIKINHFYFYISLFGSLLVVILGIVFYKAGRIGQVDGG